MISLNQLVSIHVNYVHTVSTEKNNANKKESPMKRFFFYVYFNFIA